MHEIRSAVITTWAFPQVGMSHNIADWGYPQLRLASAPGLAENWTSCALVGIGLS
jgi:hypothetical protein